MTIQNKIIKSRVKLSKEKQTNNHIKIPYEIKDCAISRKSRICLQYRNTNKNYYYNWIEFLFLIIKDSFILVVSLKRGCRILLPYFCIVFHRPYQNLFEISRSRARCSFKNDPVPRRPFLCLLSIPVHTKRPIVAFVSQEFLSVLCALSSIKALPIKSIILDIDRDVLVLNGSSY